MSNRGVVVFDLDGVLLQSPMMHTVEDPTFWQDYWGDPEGQSANEPLLDLFHMLRSQGRFHMCILTARPFSVADQTREVLSRLDIEIHHRQRAPNPEDSRTSLIMRGDEHLRRVSRSAEWKAEMIRGWIQDLGIYVPFVVEDYKPNADAIRRWVPVLLFERQKGAE